MMWMMTFATEKAHVYLLRSTDLQLRKISCIGIYGRLRFARILFLVLAVMRECLVMMLVMMYSDRALSWSSLKRTSRRHALHVWNNVAVPCSH